MSQIKTKNNDVVYPLLVLRQGKMYFAKNDPNLQGSQGPIQVALYEAARGAGNVITVDNKDIYKYQGSSLSSNIVSQEYIYPDIFVVPSTNDLNIVLVPPVNVKVVSEIIVDNFITAKIQFDSVVGADGYEVIAVPQTDLLDIQLVTPTKDQINSAVSPMEVSWVKSNNENNFIISVYNSTTGLYTNIGPYFEDAENTKYIDVYGLVFFENLVDPMFPTSTTDKYVIYILGYDNQGIPISHTSFSPVWAL